jgi:hypothetical protein
MVAENKPNHISLLASEALGFITSGKVFPEFIFGRLGYDNRLQIHGKVLSDQEIRGNGQFL